MMGKLRRAENKRPYDWAYHSGPAQKLLKRELCNCGTCARMSYGNQNGTERIAQSGTGECYCGDGKTEGSRIRQEGRGGKIELGSAFAVRTAGHRCCQRETDFASVYPHVGASPDFLAAAFQLVMQDNAQQGRVDGEFAVVFDKPQFAEAIHKEVDA
jgi:hypothetical protein